MCDGMIDNRKVTRGLRDLGSTFVAATTVRWPAASLLGLRLLQACSHHLLKCVLGQTGAITFAGRHKYGNHVVLWDDPFMRSKRTPMTKAPLGQESQHPERLVDDLPCQPIVSAGVPASLHAGCLHFANWFPHLPEKEIECLSTSHCSISFGK